MSTANVVIVGAGPAGLATAACLARAGVSALVLERHAGVASSWRHYYDRLHLHTVKELSALPFSRWPQDTPRYPSRDDVIVYLERYAREHHIHPRFNVEVTRVVRGPAAFVVETSEGRLEPRAVVIASGANAIARWPHVIGLERFGGNVQHSQTYRNAEPYRGQRVLVVGCGNSGAEIALDLAEHGVDVAVAVRSPTYIVPRDLFGQPSQKTNVMLSPLPIAMRDSLINVALRFSVGDLSPWGITRPRRGLNRLAAETGRIPVLDVGTIAAIKSGRIRIVSDLREAASGQVSFVDGRQEPFDAIVLATGYSPGLERLIERFDSIGDARGRPDRFGEESGIPGLYFVGFRSPATGALREIAIEARRVANAITRRQPSS